MTLSEELGVVDLAARGGYENSNTGVPRLCIPALTLQDSPNGVAYGATGVTQLPASLGLAASFDPSLAYHYGQVEGREARGKGIDVLQGPELNLDRVPQSGRAFEAYGEDPALTAALGVANIEGIQSEGVMADAKHYSAYNQETARLIVNQVVSRRALEELYQVPFRAAVEQAQVASLMCAYGNLNGVNTCSSPYLYSQLASWHFAGFVRSDLKAVTNAVPAFAAGMSMIKPAQVGALKAGVAAHRLAKSRLDDAVRRILTEMFRFDLVAHPLSGSIRADVASKADAELALLAAERSMVLMKNSGGVLPLDRAQVGSVAVIGADAQGGPGAPGYGAATMSAGFGSARVTAEHVVTPFAGLRSALGSGVKLSYSPGGGASLFLPPAPEGVLVASSKLTGPEPPEFSGGDPQGVSDLEVVGSPRVTRAIATASAPQPGRYWSTWLATVTPRASGLYTLSLTQRGDSWLSIDGTTLIGSSGLHGAAPWSASVELVAGRSYQLELSWFTASPEAEPRLGWAYETDAISAAVRAASTARVAVVFVNDFNSEGTDRPSLSLPGDQDALISAVAAANPRTVVVLETGGPVLMPWLSKVAAVLEGWYPGQEGGTAIGAVLTGRVDPGGHLPVTFPASPSQVPAHDAAAWPGRASTVSYSEGLDIGYRYQQAKHLTPLFPFGYGLSYTSFSLSDARESTSGSSVRVQVRVRDSGARSGWVVVQAYLGYPPGSGEPPYQLRAFASVALAAGQSKLVNMRLTGQDFQAYLGGRLRSLPGRYVIAIGTSSAQLPIRLTVRAP